MWNNVPNLLTLGRIAVIVIIVLVLQDEGHAAGALAAVFFFVACLTDYFDGQLARKYSLTTTLGKFLDPLADKLLVMAILVMLVGMSREPRVPSWLVVIVVGREIAVTGLRAIASGEGIILPAEELGKYKTIFQMFAVEALLLHYRYPIPATELAVDFHAAGMLFLWIALVLAVWSGVDYHVRILRHVRLD